MWSTGWKGARFCTGPCLAEDEAGRSEVRHVLGRFFGNSRESLMLSLLGDGEITHEELQRLKQAIAAAQSGECAMNETLLILSQHAGQVVVAGLWQGALAAVVVGLALHVLPRISAAQRFAVWAATFAIAIALPFVSGGEHGPVAGGALQVAPGWGLALAGLWLLTFAVRLARLMHEGWRVRGIWRRARAFAVSGDVQSLLALSGRGAGLFCFKRRPGAKRDRVLVAAAACAGSLDGNRKRRRVAADCAA